jgi:hypothetical protein
VLDVALIISNGSDTDQFRDIARSVAAQVAHLFTYELEEVVSIRPWDYRMDNPRVVPGGGLAARSLSMVEKSECLLAILGPTVPNITSQEITRAFERRQAGEQVAFWLFLNPDQKNAAHDEFLDGIEASFGERIVYSEYHHAMEFQARAMTTLFAYVTTRVFGRPVVGVGSATA